MSEQLTIDAVAKPFERCATLSTTEIYDELVASGVIKRGELDKLEPVGKTNQKISKLKRKIRWLIMDLKHKGVIEASGKRGVWSKAVNSTEADSSLFVSPKNLAVVAYSTDLGVSLWGDNRQLLDKISTPIQLCLTSPPYPLSKPRKYGNPPAKEYVDFILSALEPLTHKLADGGSIVLNVSNDIFEPNTPARSTYLERLTIAIEDELSLKLMDRLVWRTNKPPSPTYWACNPSHPYHLKASYEPLLWFCNNPNKTSANNRRVLVPNSENMKLLHKKGGDRRDAVYGDGAYRLGDNSFKQTLGTLRTNVLDIATNCSDSRKVYRLSKALGLKPHGAMFPTALASTLIEWLTCEGDMVLDLFSGTNKVGLAAEKLNRCWIAMEKVADFMQIQRALFVSNGIKTHD